MYTVMYTKLHYTYFADLNNNSTYLWHKYLLILAAHARQGVINTHAQIGEVVVEVCKVRIMQFGSSVCPSVTTFSATTRN